MLKALTLGDVVTVTRIDRLARSTFDLFAIVKRIVGAKAQFRSLAEPWADIGTSTGRLMIAVLGGLADVERDLIRTRTAEGRARAKARGQHMGRPPKLTPQQQREARRRRAEGATLKGLAESYNVGRSTIFPPRLAPTYPAWSRKNLFRVNPRIGLLTRPAWTLRGGRLVEVGIHRGIRVPAGIPDIRAQGGGHHPAGFSEASQKTAIFRLEIRTTRAAD